MVRTTVVLLLSSFCFSCKDANQAVPSEPHLILRLTIEDFPNHVGTAWTYGVNDSITGRQEMSTVSVETNPNVSENQSSTLWITVRGNHSDTMIVTASDNRIELQNNQSPNFPEVFTFPLSVGDTWGIGIDVSSVVGVDDVTTPQGTFKSAFHIRRHAFSFNYSLSVDTWIAQNVGIVKRHIVAYNLGQTIREEWELLSRQPR